MAHFAKLNDDNEVIQVIVVANEVILDSDGVEQESIGVSFINNLYGTNDVWKQTSYNNNFRKNYAGVGYTYDKTRDAFIEPKPYDSWVLNETTCRYEPPIPYPTDSILYDWDENNLSWITYNE